MKLIELAQILRSKNAGPLNVTFDIFFDSKVDYEMVITSGVINANTISKIYRVDLSKVAIIEYGIVNAIKIAIPRDVVSGGFLDDDIYGCQRHKALANIEIE